MKFLIKDLKLEVIATFQDNEQDMFQITRIYADDLKSETSLLSMIKEQLKRSSEDLVKFSLCWICNDIKPYANNPTIKATLEKNGKYFFGSWA
jgi:hypothetical protein|tara:strand:+ start:227 stop:505 length:279 start_codon:yes stop_codon:yes gene_type:complete